MRQLLYVLIGLLNSLLFCLCRCGRYPPEVRTAIPVDGRFEHIVLSCNATSDHGIIWIEREAEKAIKVSQMFFYFLKLLFSVFIIIYLGAKCVPDVPFLISHFFPNVTDTIERKLTFNR